MDVAAVAKSKKIEVQLKKLEAALGTAMDAEDYDRCDKISEQIQEIERRRLWRSSGRKLTGSGSQLSSSPPQTPGRETAPGGRAAAPPSSTANSPASTNVGVAAATKIQSAHRGNAVRRGSKWGEKGLPEKAPARMLVVTADAVGVTALDTASDEAAAKIQAMLRGRMTRQAIDNERSTADLRRLREARMSAASATSSEPTKQAFYMACQFLKEQKWEEALAYFEQSLVARHQLAR